MFSLDNKTVLITGGTGSFGKSFTKYLLENFNLKKLIVFSRDELKQFQMEKEIVDPRLRFFIGDVRDLPRLQRALCGVDVVIHAAALKQVPALEYNPFEAVKTNILGTQNILEACIDQGVEKAVLISTDKAAHPVNLYGATKLCAEKLFIGANSYSANRCKFVVVRYGNVIGSRGSIVETLLKKKDVDTVYITDERMSRFWLTLKQSMELVMKALKEGEGGEIFIPKAPSQLVKNLFEALVPAAKKVISGIRPGEKLHEVLLTNQESRHAVETENHYIVLPEFLDTTSERYQKYAALPKVPENFQFASDSNAVWLTIEEFKELLENV